MPLAGRSLPCRSAGVRMEFGDSFYQGFEKWAAEYPEEDRINFPEYFVLPKGVYEVSLQKPLGIAFEEIEVGKGVKVRRARMSSSTDTRIRDCRRSKPLRTALIGLHLFVRAGSRPCGGVERRKERPHRPGTRVTGRHGDQGVHATTSGAITRRAQRACCPM